MFLMILYFQQVPDLLKKTFWMPFIVWLIWAGSFWGTPNPEIQNGGMQAMRRSCFWVWALLRSCQRWVPDPNLRELLCRLTAWSWPQLYTFKLYSGPWLGNMRPLVYVGLVFFSACFTWGRMIYGGQRTKLNGQFILNIHTFTKILFPISAENT